MNGGGKTGGGKEGEKVRLKKWTNAASALKKNEKRKEKRTKKEIKENWCRISTLTKQLQQTDLPWKSYKDPLKC